MKRRREFKMKHHLLRSLCLLLRRLKQHLLQLDHCILAMHWLQVSLC